MTPSGGHTWAYDQLGRITTMPVADGVNEAWAHSTELDNHYDGDGDKKSWIANDVTPPDDITRHMEGVS